jgi:hypothetical protein
MDYLDYTLNIGVKEVRIVSFLIRILEEDHRLHSLFLKQEGDVLEVLIS